MRRSFWRFHGQGHSDCQRKRKPEVYLLCDQYADRPELSVSAGYGRGLHARYVSYHKCPSGCCSRSFKRLSSDLFSSHTQNDPTAWTGGSKLPNLDMLRKRIVLADGGIYDNMGLESLIDNVDIALVSDAGAPFEVDENPAEDDIFQLGRVHDILTDQTRALRKRWLISEFEAEAETRSLLGHRNVNKRL